MPGAGPLFVWERGAWFSVRVSWDGDGPDRRLDHWYVNLHTPLVRTRHGFDIADLVLDVVVQPDLARWAWKDETEFDDAVRTGAITPDQAHRARQAGQTAVERAAAGTDPFVARWADWRPDPRWSVPPAPPDDITTQSPPP